MCVDMDNALEDLEILLKEHQHLSHITARKYRNTLVLQSGTKEDPIKHTRFVHVNASLWELSFPHHSGRWERTQLIDTLNNLFQQLLNDFSFYLNPDL